MNNFSNTYQLPGTTRAAQTWWSQITEGLQNLRTRWSQRQERLRQLNELYYCTDRELWDLGISRSDFLAIRNGSYRRD